MKDLLDAVGSDIGISGLLPKEISSDSEAETASGLSPCSSLSP